MELHAAMETFAEAWIAANMQNYVIDTQQQQVSQLPKQEVTHFSIDNNKDSQKNDQKIQIIEKMENTKLSFSNNSCNNHNADLQQLSQTATSLLGVKTISLRCIVEQEVSMATSTLSDSQVFLPGSLLFVDIVRGALLKLGFAVSEAIAAKGSVQLQHWNGVEVERMTDDSRATIEHILGHVAAICTLRIKLNKLQMDEIEWDEQAVRCAVLKLLKHHNQVALSRMCPIPQSMISNIANSKYTSRLCGEKCREFGQWFAEYQQGVSTNTIDYTPSSSSRITFHPTYELPLLRKWYAQCPNPSTEHLKRFLVELNMAPVRQERDKVPLRRLRVWWRNEKQRLKRNEGEEGKVDEAGGGKKRKKRKKKKIVSMVAPIEQKIECNQDSHADRPTDNHTENQEYTECFEERSEEYADPPPAHDSHPSPLTSTTLFHDPIYASTLFHQLSSQ